MFPDVPSMIVPPGFSFPARSASSIIFTAMRSLIELPGLKVSIFASTSAATIPFVMRWMRTIGVSPIAPRIVSVTGRAISALVSSKTAESANDHRRDHINRVMPPLHAVSLNAAVPVCCPNATGPTVSHDAARSKMRGDTSATTHGGSMSRLLAVSLLALSLAPASAQFDNVGTISFPTSGSAAAQPHFLRAVAILHSFGWKQAIAEFREAQKLQPDFAMAYWGETLCYNHPLQNEQDAKSPREVLARLGATPAARLAKAPTDREKGFLQAVEILWGDGDDWRARRVGYMNAMERLAQQYPDDDEVKTFYAVSLLSGARALDDNTFRYEMKAGAIALDVFKRNPNHPGCAALHHPRVRRSDSRAAGARGGARLRRASFRRSRTVSTCRPTSSSSTGCGTRWPIRTSARSTSRKGSRGQPGDSPGDMAHSGDWGQYGFLQLGDYAGARDRTMALEGSAQADEESALARRASRSRVRATSSRPKSGRCSRSRMTRRPRRSSPTA